MKRALLVLLWVVMTAGVAHADTYDELMADAPTAVQKSEYEIVRTMYLRYKQGFSANSVLPVLNCTEHVAIAKEGGNIIEAFANDPAMTYVAELHNIMSFDGELSFGHDGKRRYGAYNQNENLIKNNVPISFSVWVVYEYVRFVYMGRGSHFFKYAYSTLSAAFSGTYEGGTAIEEKVSRNEPIKIQFADKKNKSHKLAALWAAGLLVRAYEKQGETELAKNARELLEKPLEKIVGYGLGDIDTPLRKAVEENR